MNRLPLCVAALASLSLAWGAGCSSKCSPSNCSGCCDANSTCQDPSATYCGINGGACSQCIDFQVCQEGVCEVEGSGGNGGPSGGATGTATTVTGSVSAAASGNTQGGGSSGVASATGFSTGTPGTTTATFGDATSNSGTSGTGSPTAATSTAATVTVAASSSSGTSGTTGCDCQPCYNSGLECDAATCTCEESSSTGSTGTSGSTGGCDCQPCFNSGLQCDASTCTCEALSTSSASTSTSGTSGTTATSLGTTSGSSSSSGTTGGPPNTLTGTLAFTVGKTLDLFDVWSDGGVYPYQFGVLVSDDSTDACSLIGGYPDGGLPAAETDYAYVMFVDLTGTTGVGLDTAYSSLTQEQEQNYYEGDGGFGSATQFIQVIYRSLAYPNGLVSVGGSATLTQDATTSEIDIELSNLEMSDLTTTEGTLSGNADPPTQCEIEELVE